MILKVFSVFDGAVGAYMAPFFMHSRGQAIRSFSDTADDANSTIGKHPQDYTLFELGEFDDSCARFDMHATPHSLGVASELLAKPKSS